MKYTYTPRISRIILLLTLAVLLPLSAYCEKRFSGRFVCTDAPISIVLSLYDNDAEIPGMPFFGATPGYIMGQGIANTWLITKATCTDTEAEIRLSNDNGSYTQQCTLTLESDSILILKTRGANVLKKVEGRKLVTLPGTLLFKRQ